MGAGRCEGHTESSLPIPHRPTRAPLSPLHRRAAPRPCAAAAPLPLLPRRDSSPPPLLGPCCRSSRARMRLRCRCLPPPPPPRRPPSSTPSPASSPPPPLQLQQGARRRPRLEGPRSFHLAVRQMLRGAPHQSSGPPSRYPPRLAPSPCRPSLAASEGWPREEEELLPSHRPLVPRRRCRLQPRSPLSSPRRPRPPRQPPSLLQRALPSLQAAQPRQQQPPRLPLPQRPPPGPPQAGEPCSQRRRPRPRRPPQLRRLLRLPLPLLRTASCWTWTRRTGWCGLGLTTRLQAQARSSTRSPSRPRCEPLRATL